MLPLFLTLLYSSPPLYVPSVQRAFLPQVPSYAPHAKASCVPLPTSGAQHIIILPKCRTPYYAPLVPCGLCPPFKRNGMVRAPHLVGTCLFADPTPVPIALCLLTPPGQSTLCALPSHRCPLCHHAPELQTPYYVLLLSPPCALSDRCFVMFHMPTNSCAPPPHRCPTCTHMMSGQQCWSCAGG